MNAKVGSTADDDDNIQQIAVQFLTPKRASPKAWPSQAQAITLTVPATSAWVDGPYVDIVCHRIGNGPAALLVHGWQSQGADLMALALALAEAGFSVWVPDLPAHGHSKGRCLSIPLAVRALLAVQGLAGEIAIAVGHSVGAAALVHALDQGLHAARVALLAPATHYGMYARQIAGTCGLDSYGTRRLLERLSELIGEPIDGIDMFRQAGHREQSALLMHSLDDIVVPASATQQVAALWRRACWRPLDGVGHFQILVAPDVLAQVAGFAVQSGGAIESKACP
jgi:pimeloyl-ACP methyl ester carboxylesterase